MEGAASIRGARLRHLPRITGLRTSHDRQHRDAPLPMILTSNQSFGTWGEVFGDRVIASAHPRSSAASCGEAEHPRQLLSAEGEAQGRTCPLAARRQHHSTGWGTLASKLGKIRRPLTPLRRSVAPAAKPAVVANQVSIRPLILSEPLPAIRSATPNALDQTEMRSPVGQRTVMYSRRSNTAAYVRVNRRLLTTSTHAI